MCLSMCRTTPVLYATSCVVCHSLCTCIFIYILTFCGRAFNTRSLTNATLGFDAVQEVEYDSRDPGRERVTFSTLGPDLRPLPPLRIELFINAARSSVDVLKLQREGNPPPESFCTAELYRQVTLGVRAAQVRDYEVVTSFRFENEGLVQATQRVAVYLQPQDAAYFQAGGRAVTVYDYALTLTRVGPDGGAPAGAAACVPTPKDVVQCV